MSGLIAPQFPLRLIRWHMSDMSDCVEIARGYEVEFYLEPLEGVRVLYRLPLATWLAAKARKQGREALRG